MTDQEQGHDEHGAQGLDQPEPGAASQSGGEAANPELEGANVGDQGEQVPADKVGGDQDRAVAQSPPPPGAQSGVPLEADRAAGVEGDPESAGHVQSDAEREAAEQAAPPQGDRPE